MFCKQESKKERKEKKEGLIFLRGVYTTIAIIVSPCGLSL